MIKAYSRFQEAFIFPGTVFVTCAVRTMSTVNVESATIIYIIQHFSRKLWNENISNSKKSFEKLMFFSTDLDLGDPNKVSLVKLRTLWALLTDLWQLRISTLWSLTLSSVLWSETITYLESPILICLFDAVWLRWQIRFAYIRGFPSQSDSCFSEILSPMPRYPPLRSITYQIWSEYIPTIVKTFI